MHDFFFLENSIIFAHLPSFAGASEGALLKKGQVPKRRNKFLELAMCAGTLSLYIIFESTSFHEDRIITKVNIQLSGCKHHLTVTNVQTGNICRANTKSEALFFLRME